MRFAPLFLAAALLAGCNPTGSDDRPIVVPAPPEYATAPETLDLNGASVVLAATLSRDFMPTVPIRPDGGPLAVVATVRGVDPGTMTSAIEVISLAVVRDREAWMTRFTGAPSIPEVVAVRATGGPRWGPGISVDVVTRLRLPSGDVKLLAVRGVPITATH